jgi:hypothetical protein
MTNEPDPAAAARLEQRLYDMGDQDPDPVGDASAWAWARAAVALIALIGGATLFGKLVMAWVMPL